MGRLERRDGRRRWNVARLSRAERTPEQEEAGGRGGEHNEKARDHAEAPILVARFLASAKKQFVVRVVRLEPVDDRVSQIGELVLHCPQVHLRKRQLVLRSEVAPQVVEVIDMYSILEEEAPLPFVRSLKVFDGTVGEFDVVGARFE